MFILLTKKILMRESENDITVDGCHPNDWGFASMAKAVGDVLKKYYNKNAVTQNLYDSIKLRF